MREKKNCPFLSLRRGKAEVRSLTGVSQTQGQPAARLVSPISSQQRRGSHLTVRGTLPGNSYSLKGKNVSSFRPEDFCPAMCHTRVSHPVKSAASLTRSDAGCHLFPVSPHLFGNWLTHADIPQSREALYILPPEGLSSLRHIPWLLYLFWTTYILKERKCKQRRNWENYTFSSNGDWKELQNNNNNKETICKQQQ